MCEDCDKKVDEIFSKLENKITKNSGPRPSCVACCLKHIGTAITQLSECLQADEYKHYRWLAVGELNEAANEIVKDFPEIAKEIRDIRHQIISGDAIPNLINLVKKLDDMFF